MDKNDYECDALGRLKKLTQDDQDEGNVVEPKRVDFAYNLASQFDTITRYNDLAGGSGDLIATSTYGYDRTGRLTSLAHDDGGAPNALPEYTLVYDEANRLFSFSNSAYPDEDIEEYSYDDKGQLIGVDDGGMSLREDYDFDANGNRQTANGDTYATGAGNRITSDGTYTYYHDDEGNLTTKEIDEDNYTSYTYDHRNRMATATFVVGGSAVKSVRYTYDPMDRLVKRSVDITSPFTHTDAAIANFVYDGPDVALQFNGSGELTTRYLNGPAVDQILAEETIAEGESSGVLWMQADHQGSIRDVQDNTGAAVNHISYDGFGNVLDEEDPAVQRTYGYAGYFVDEATGFYGTQTRWYNPYTGRWTTEDWIGFAAGDSSLFRYVGNGPTNAVDPTGLVISSDCPLDDYLDLYLLSYVEKKSDGKYFYTSGVGGIGDRLRGEILSTMMESSYRFEVSGTTRDAEFRNIRRHVDIRHRIVTNTTVVKFGFGERVFNHSNPMHPTIDDIQAFFRSVNNPTTMVGCWWATALVFYFYCVLLLTRRK